MVGRPGLFIGTALALAACGDSASTITVDVEMAVPSYVKYRTDGVWREPRKVVNPDFGATYSFDAAGDFALVAACEDDQGSFYVAEILGQPGASIDHWTLQPPALDLHGGCSGHPSQVTSVVSITGTTSERGIVELWDTSSGGQVPFTLRVPPGRHDLVAVNTEITRAVVRRALDLETDQTLPLIDFAAEGVPVEALSIPITNAAQGAQYGSTTELAASEGYLELSRTPQLLAGIARSNLQDTDSEYLMMSADSGTTDSSAVQEARGYYTTASGAMNLLPVPFATFTTTAGVAANWNILPEPLDYAALSLHAFAGGTSTIVVYCDREYVESQSSLRFDPPPDLDARFTPAWVTDPSSQHSFTVGRHDASWWYTSSTSSSDPLAR